MGKRTSVYLSGDLARMVTNRYDIDTSISSTLNLIAARYAELLRECRPDLTTDEWTKALDAVAAAPPIDHRLPLKLRLKMMRWIIEDSGLSLKTLNFAELLVIFELAERWGVTEKAERSKLLRV